MDINKVYLGDCLEIMPSIQDKSIDMVLCDLPYGSTACSWDTIIPFEPLWKEYKRLIKDNGAIVLTASQPFTSALVVSNPKMFKYEWIWNKRKAGNFALGNIQPLKVHENIIVFCKGQSVYNPQKIALQEDNKRYLGKASKNKGDAIGIKGNIKYGKEYEPNKLLPVSIQEFKKDNYRNNAIHPTQKPVALFEYLIKTYTNEGDLVLDNAAGSGTTGVACKNLKRNYILIEKEPKYYDIILKRLSETQPRLLDK